MRREESEGHWRDRRGSVMKKGFSKGIRVFFCCQTTIRCVSSVSDTRWVWRNNDQAHQNSPLKMVTDNRLI